ncbi:MAG: hypothetical protein JXP34_03550 [Planctomycetes bacterium]|nr:hypothetical protein [Planctomycetota bacterium]
MERNPNSSHRGALATGFATVAFGAHALAAQTLLVREILVAFHGNELSLGAVFAAWLVGVGGGALTCRPIARRERVRAPAVFASVLVVLAVLLPLQLLAARGLRAILGVPWGEFPPLGSAALAGLAIVVPSSGAIGFGFAFACRAAQSAGAAGPVGLAYGLESLGSLIGGVAVTFILIPRAPVFAIAAIASATALAGAAAISLRPPDGRPSRAIALAAAVLLAVVTAAGPCGGIGALERASLALRWRSVLARGRILVASRDTPYQNLALISDGERLLLYGDGDLAFPLSDVPAEEEAAHTILVESAAPRRVLIIGGSPGFVREALKHPIEHLDLVAADPAVRDFILPHLDAETRAALEDPRVAFSRADPRPFIRAARRGSYDAVILEVPEPATASRNRLFTREFYEDIRAALAPDGFVTVAVTSSVQLEEEAAGYAATIDRTLRAVFRRILVTYGQTNRFFAGGERSPITFDRDVLRERFASRRIATEYFDEVHFLASEAYDPEKTAFVAGRLAAAAAPINEDLRPTAYVRNLVLWARYTGSAAARRVAGLRDLPAWRVAAALVAPAILALAWSALRRRRGRRILPLAYAMGSTGFAGMALEIAVLLVYQTASGALYERVGLVVGVFMAGIAGGSLLARRGAAGRNALLAADGAIALLAAATPAAAIAAIRWPGAAEPILLAWVLAIGTGTGREFAIAGRGHGGDGGEDGRATGRRGAVLEAADHIGAALGAGLAGVVLVPVFGIVASCLAIAAAKAGSVALVALGGGGGGSR